MTDLGTNPGVAVVTGASSGIGAAFADRLARRGHDLLLVARRGDRLSTLAAQLQAETGVGVETLVADLGRADDLARLEARIADIPVSFLVNNAGVGALGPTSSVPAGAQEALIRINVVALTRLSIAAVARFSAAGRGTLINIASVMALMPSAGGGAYSGSKAYVLNFTRSLRLELGGSGIGVHVVLPGPVRTEFFSSQGLSDSVFPDSAYVSAEALADAALAGAALGEEVITPSLASADHWRDLEAARGAYMRDVMSGEIAARYRPG